MKPQINAATVAVKDIKALRKFYHEILGWTVLSENAKVVILKMDNAAFTLCTMDVFSEYTGMQPGSGNKSFYLTINLESPKRVDESFKKLKQLSVNIVKMPQKTFWGGYSGFFTDPENNYWEICFNPIPGTKS
jgi:hypothetical protein